MEEILLLVGLAIVGIVTIAFIVCSAAFPRFNTMVAGVYATLMIIATIGLFVLNFFVDEGLYGAIIFAIMVFLWFLYRVLCLVRGVLDEEVETHIYLILGTLIEERGPGKLAKLAMVLLGGTVISLVAGALAGGLMFVLSLIHLDIITIIIPLIMLIYCIISVVKSFSEDY